MDDIGGNRHVLGRRGSVKSQRRGRYFHGRGLLLQRKLDRQRIDRPCRGLDLIHRVHGETWCRDRHLVQAERNILEGKRTFTRGDRGMVNPCGGIRGFHRRIGNNSSRGIRHRSINCPAERLRVRPHGDRQNNKNC